MALKKTVQTSFGLEVKDAFHRVENVSIVTKNRMVFNVMTRVDADHPIFAERLVECGYDIGGENPIAQAYAYLKTLPEFAGAVDC